MAEPGLFKSKCPFCDKTIGVRSDQLGRRVRCPACRRSFEVEGPFPLTGDEPTPPIDLPVDSPPIEFEYQPVDDANELARAPGPRRNWPKAKLSTHFPRSRPLAFQSAIQAVRNGRCEIVDLDWTNHHLRFALTNTRDRTSEHDLYAFDALDGGCDIDLASREPNEENEFDAYYQAIAREIGKYLLFAANPPLPAAPAPLSLPAPEYEPPPPRRRRRRREESQALGIAGFVCGLVGLVFFCIPILGGLLGVLAVVFSAIEMSQNRTKKGFATAGLALGIITCGLAFVMFLVYLSDVRR